MRRSCDRPGCVGAAVLAFQFDGAARVVRLEAVTATTERAGQGLLCERHARRFAPPLGWTVLHVGTDAGPDPSSAGAPPLASATAAQAAPAVRPPVDDVERLLDADSPLLARAFRTALRAPAPQAGREA